MTRFASLVLALSFALGPVFLQASPASAQPAPQPGAQTPSFAAAQTSGTLARYIVGPAGHVRGFVLDNGVLVMLQGPGDAMAQQVPVGQAVRVEGFVVPGNEHVFHRTTVYGPSGAVVAAPMGPPPGAEGPWQHWGPGMGGPGAGHGPGQGHGPGMGPGPGMGRFAQLQPFNAAGAVAFVLGGPRGGVHGLLLADGTSVFLPRPLAMAVHQRGGIRVGEVVRVSGRGGHYALGASVLAEQIVFADGSQVSLPAGIQ